MICVSLKCYLTEGRLEVFQGEKLLSSIPMWTTFGELAILYNCTRTASVKGKKREAVGSLQYLKLSPKPSWWHSSLYTFIHKNIIVLKRFIIEL